MTSFPSSDDSVQQIKDAADIVEIIGEHVNLKKAGANYKGLCPFHAEKTPSFTVNPARGSFHCFGCNEGGDVFSFYMQYHNATFPEALKELARRYNITLPEKPVSQHDQAKARKRTGLYDVLERASRIFHTLLLNDPRAAVARQYLQERGIPEEIILNFRLGYAPDSWDYLTAKIKNREEQELAAEAGLIVKKDRGGFYDRFRNRLLCPIFSMTGQVAGFSGRILDDGQPKYMNSPESPVFDKSRLLFGLYQNRKSVRKHSRCLLVEGNFDLLSLTAHGFDYAAAPLGTALTGAQIRALKGYADEVIIVFDADAAGLKAAMRAVPLFLAEQVSARVCSLPKGHDPDTFLREKDPQALELKLQESQPLPEFVFSSLSEKYGMGLEGKTRIASELRSLLKELGDHQLQKSVFISHFSQKLGVPAAELAGDSKPASPINENRRSPVPADSSAKLPLQQKQLLEFLIIFPEYLQKFIEAGIENVVRSPIGRNIIQHLKEIAPSEHGGQERLLDLTDGPEKSFISRLLVTSPSYDTEDIESAVTEKLAWLRRNELKMRQEELTRQINEAQESGDVKLCMQLIEQKKALDKIHLEQ